MVERAQTAAAGTSITGIDAHCAWPPIRARTELAAVIDQIVDLANVPMESRSWASKEIENLVVSITNRHHGRSAGAEAEDEAEQKKLQKEWFAHLGRLTKARALFRKAAIELQLAIADYDQTYGEADRCYDAAPQPIDALLNDILAWASAPPPFEIDCSAAFRAPAGLGRPSGPKTDEFFRFVAILLLFIGDAAGGKLAFDKNYPAESPLVKALELLRPHVPWLIPEVIPRRTLIALQMMIKQGRPPFEKLLRTITGLNRPALASLPEKLLDRIVRLHWNENSAARRPKAS